MTELGDSFRRMRDHKKDAKQKWHERRMATFDKAVAMAQDNGMDLIEISSSHCQLLVYNPEGNEIQWLYNLYPTTGRINTDRNHKGPFLNVRNAWDFPDVVRAATYHQRALSS